MRTHQIFRQSHTAFYRQWHRPFRIQNIHICNCCKSMILGYLHMHGCFYSGTAIRRVAFHNRPIYWLYQLLNQLRIQIVAGRRLPGAEFYCHLTFRCPAKRLINAHQSFRADVRRHVNHWCFLRVIIFCRTGIYKTSESYRHCCYNAKNLFLSHFHKPPVRSFACS